MPSVVARNDARLSVSDVSSVSRRQQQQALAFAAATAHMTSDVDEFRDHEEEEEEYDADRYNEHAGAEDSEDEEDVGISLETEIEKQVHMEANTAAEPLEPELVDSTMDDEDNAIAVSGAPPGWKPPGPPDSWKLPEPKPGRGEPPFSEVDNPGCWSSYVYQPVFDKSGKKAYSHHALPTGATVVPENDKGERSVNGWDFYYEGWMRLPGEGVSCRHGATRANMFPDERKGSLDKDVLLKLGMSPERMSNENKVPDALFFYQLLLPICDTSEKHSEVKNDPRKSFYYDVSKFTNQYAMFELDLGNGYGHHWDYTDPTELLHWDGVTVMDGVRGGSQGAMLRRFDPREDNTAYDKYVAKAMTKTRWLEIKRCIKLCNNKEAPKKAEANYNPAYKYDMIFDTIISNVNALTHRACLDLGGDETSIAHGGYGEKGTGILSRVLNKPGLTKGMQIVLVSDIDWIRPRAYMHRHKVHEKEEGWSLQGPAEVKHILKDLDELIVNDFNSLIGKPIFAEHPHITWDNFFSGEKIAMHCASKGYGMTTTLRRDRFPSGVPKKFFHFQKTQPGAARPRAAKYIAPIVAVKKVHHGSLMQLTSFQSTSSCNFLSVNAYDSCNLYAVTKERGQRKSNHKRQWAIEMNEARHLYLKSYGIIDRLDHLIKNCHMHYRYVLLQVLNIAKNNSVANKLLLFVIM